MTLTLPHTRDVWILRNVPDAYTKCKYFPVRTTRRALVRARATEPSDYTQKIQLMQLSIEGHGKQVTMVTSMDNLKGREMVRNVQV